MGAYHFRVSLKDDPLHEFLRLALDGRPLDGNVSDWEFGMQTAAAYIAQRFIDAVPELEEFRPAAPPPSCPECSVGKHGNCDGTTWSNRDDQLVPCPCPWH